MQSLPIPKGLVALLDAGVWPKTGREANAQNLRPIVPAQVVSRFAPKETVVFLQPPPFPTVEAMANQSVEFWAKYCALDQIDPARSLIIGDFGLGSDAPIILDYRHNTSSPAVLWLRWSEHGRQDNEWIRCADSFEEFAALIGLARNG
jgi:hypothetical protein